MPTDRSSLEPLVILPLPEKRPSGTLQLLLNLVSWVQMASGPSLRGRSARVVVQNVNGRQIVLMECGSLEEAQEEARVLRGLLERSDPQTWLDEHEIPVTFLSEPVGGVRQLPRMFFNEFVLGFFGKRTSRSDLGRPAPDP